MYAVIQIPVFPLQALLRRMRKRPRGPLAVLDESGEQSYVICTNKLASRHEVIEGMRPAKALARCRGLQLLTRSEDAEEESERLLLLLAQTLSPRIERTELGTATVDLKGADPKKQKTRCEALIERIRSRGLFARIGIADTPDHALWAATQAQWVLEVRKVDAFLKQLPLDMLRTRFELITILEGWGIHDLSRFKQLPREEVGARLGQEGLNLWDAVSGRRVRPLRHYHGKPQFIRKLELDYRVENMEALLFILKRFVDELAIELQVAHKAAFIFKIYLQLENKQVQKKTIEVPVASSRASTLFRILETALENFQTQGPIIGVYLKLETADALARQGDLFAVAMEDVVGFAETADRIAALVGPGRSGSPRLNDTWRPDSFRLEKLDTEVPTFEEEEAVETLISLPLNRFRPPRPIQVYLQEEVPESIEGQISGQVVKAKGPWTSSSDWWDQQPWSREEWDVELDQGGIYRIFRNRQGWYAEGSYG